MKEIFFMSQAIILISLIWIISEILLARTNRALKDVTENLDKSTLKLLWIVITISVSIGVFCGITGRGMIPFNFHFNRVIGLSLIVVGLIIRWTAIFTLRKYFTVNVSVMDDHQIVKNGLYRYVRHPSYLGSLISFLGLGLSFSNWLSILIITIPIAIAFLIRINIEEKVLFDHLGKKYLDYCKTTKRLLPKVY